MVKNFQKYLLLEKSKSQIVMILEGNEINSSGNFLNKLNSISKTKGVVGDIARALYDLMNDGYWVNDIKKIKQNYFDTTDKEDKVSFLMNNKVPQDWDEDSDPSLPYTMRGRGELAIGKTIRYLLTLAQEEKDLEIDFPKDKDIEQFVNVYKSTTSSEKFKFKLLKGDEIAKYYNEKKYLNKSGSLGGSCMSDESKSTFKIYSQNESKVQLLVYIDEESDKISGRALVWKLKDSPCEATYFMDRVYTNRDSDFFKFREYAEEKGYLYKQKMNSFIEDNVCFRYKGSEVYGEITVKIDGSARNYPFVDTLCFMNKEKTLLSNLSSPDCYMLHSVGGDCDNCDNCAGFCLDCDMCYNQEEIECENCDGSGATDSGKCVTCKGKGKYKCEHEDAVFCRDCGEGHQTLASKGIKTELYNKISK